MVKIVDPDVLAHWLDTAPAGQRLAYFEGPSLSALARGPGPLAAKATAVSCLAWRAAGMPVIERTPCHHVLRVCRQPSIATIVHERVANTRDNYRYWLIKTRDAAAASREPPREQPPARQSPSPRRGR